MIELNPILCEEINRIQLSLIHFGHACLGTEWTGKNNAIPCTQLYYIAKGSATVVCNEHLFTMDAGNWYLLPTGSSVKHWCDDFMEEFYFHFKLCNIDQTDLLQNYPFPCHLKSTEDLTDFFSHCMNSYSPNDGIRLRNVLFSVLLDFIETYHIPLNNKKPSPCAAKALDYINEHLSIQLKIEEIVQNAYVSKSTLEVQFKEAFGTSVHNYINDTVMLEASKLLSMTDLSVQEISQRLGFCDQFYFSKRFKKRFSTTPREYRQAIKIKQL